MTVFKQDLLKNIEIIETCREVNPTYTDTVNQTIHPSASMHLESVS